MKGIKFLYFFFIIFKADGQCIQLYGKIINHVDKKAVSATISARVNGRKQDLGKADEKGDFRITIPCEAKSISLIKNDFRDVEIPLVNPEQKGLYYVNFPMVPLDKETVDKIYPQSEQSDLVLTSAKNEKTSTRYFKVFDAISKEVLESKVCLYYTKSGKKDCFETGKKRNEKIVFKEADIVAVEVESKSHQSYFGNLVINKLDNRTSDFEITLLKTPTFLSGNVQTVGENPLQKAELLNNNTKKTESIIQGNSFYAYLDEPGEYRYQVITRKKVFEESIKINPGLNFLAIEEPKPQPVSVPEKENFKMDSVQVIYFEQTEHELTITARRKLDSVKVYMLSNKTINARILGHTDNIGDPEMNKTLSEYRARATYTYLLKAGIDPKRLSWVSYGGSKPAGPNDNENNKKKNRRVEIIYASN